MTYRPWHAVLACLTSLGCASEPAPPSAVAGPASAPEWTRGAVCYEVFVRSFFDSNGDGIGDLAGLTAKLDYINDGNPDSATDLGASCIWLMPVAESPSYHGYDVSDYDRVERDYGTNDDFRRFVAEAHRRGIRVLVDMVLNHASSEHATFQAALRDTASPYRAWYRFAPTPPTTDSIARTRWHRSPVRDEYYYGLFWKGMPDLDYHTPAVREEAKRIATFWLKDMDVDGFRLDAVQFLVEDGACYTNCSGTHAVLREYADHVRSVKPDAYTVGEVWATMDTLLAYYPDQLTSYFGFMLADSLLAAVTRGTAGGLLADFLRLQDTVPAYRWSPILSNHDRTRAMTSLGADANRARLAATLLLTLPGLPFVYYGEEIGMMGDKPDERLRTPMQWSARPGLGFTTGTPWERAQPDSFTVTVDAQSADSASLLALYRRLIHLRRENPALGTGLLLPVTSTDSGVVAYVRRAGDRAVLVVVNLRRGDAIATIAAAERTLRPGRYAVRDLLGAGDALAVDVGATGAIEGYQPLSRPLRPGECLVLELMPR